MCETRILVTIHIYVRFTTVIVYPKIMPKTCLLTSANAMDSTAIVAYGIACYCIGYYIAYRSWK